MFDKLFFSDEESKLCHSVIKSGIQKKLQLELKLKLKQISRFDYFSCFYRKKKVFNLVQRFKIVPFSLLFFLIDFFKFEFNCYISGIHTH